MFGLLKKIFGTKQDKDVQAFQARVLEINQYFDQYTSLSNDQLRNKTLEFKERIKEYLSNIDQEINDLKDTAASTRRHSSEGGNLQYYRFKKQGAQ
jgi:preprotein translocase subunit SecA